MSSNKSKKFIYTIYKHYRKKEKGHGEVNKTSAGFFVHDLDLNLKFFKQTSSQSLGRPLQVAFMLSFKMCHH
jgi:hypothetical protein